MRIAWLILVVGCGRIGFDPLGTATTSLDVGDGFSCAAVDGRVACWGRNDEGQLGRGTLAVDPAPGWVPELGGVESVAMAETSTFAIDDSGTVWSWGHTTDYTLGTGETAPRPMPARSPDLTGITQVSAGTGTCARASTGALTCWGDADAGQLAIGSAPDFAMPTTSVLTGVAQVAIGTDHGCAIAQHQLVCFGIDAAGEVGVAITQATDSCQSIDDAILPCAIAPVAVPGGVDARFVAAGRTHTCAIFADELVYCWGSNVDGQLGDGSNTDSATPVVAQGLGAAIDIAAGRHHTCAVLADGSAWCWGRGSDGELGNGSFAGSNLPVRVDVPVALVALRADESGYHTCAVDEENAIWCWGANDVGQLGAAPPTDSATPLRVVLPVE